MAVTWLRGAFVVRHGPNITAVMKGCCQGHLQRELLVPPVHPKTTLTAPPRCTVFVVAMHRHVDHWASTKGHTKEETQTCRSYCWLLVVGCCWLCVCWLSFVGCRWLLVGCWLVVGWLVVGWLVGCWLFVGCLLVVC